MSELHPDQDPEMWKAGVLFILVSSIIFLCLRACWIPGIPQ